MWIFYRENDTNPKSGILYRIPLHHKQSSLPVCRYDEASDGKIECLCACIIMSSSLLLIIQEDRNGD